MKRLFVLLAFALPCPADEVSDRIRELGDDDVTVRDAAVDRLIAIGTAAEAALRKALAHEDPEVQSRAAYALRMIAWRQVIPEKFRKAHPEVPEAILVGDEPARIDWLQKLGRECGKDAVPAALLYLADDSERLRMDALKLIGARPEGLASQRDLLMYERFHPFLSDPNANMRLLAVKAAGEWLRADGAADAFVEEARRRAGPPLLAASRADDEFVRSAAAQALGKVRIPGAVEALSEATRDGKALVRIAAVRALAELGDAKGAPAATARLADENPEAVREALRTCRILKADGAAAGVRQVLAKAELPSNVRQAALEVLAELDPSAAEDARRLVDDGNATLRAIARRMLIPRDAELARTSVESDAAEVRLAAAEALSRAPRETAVPLLLKLLDDGATVTLRSAFGGDLLRSEIRVEAMLSLEELTGRKSDLRDKEAAAAEWRAWWAAGGK